MTGEKVNLAARAWKFIFLLGLVSLFADVTYEGARSITGQYLFTLGATGTIVGFLAGTGELVGYALRLLSGYLTDRTGKYWTITLWGYFINLLAVPMLALTGRWEIATILIIGERMGKGLRTPARDAMLSYATKQVGRGRGFGFHEAMDQIGAVLGPLIVTGVLYFKGGYRTGFAILLVPALIALLLLLTARYLYPEPRRLEPITPPLTPQGFTRFPSTFWLYLLAVAFIAAGYADFQLMAFHFQKREIVPVLYIPLLYAVAMGVDAFSALFFGWLYDRLGKATLALSASLSSFFAPLVFLGNFPVAVVGTALWGVGMGAQESIMRAAIADIAPVEYRGTAYGIFNAGYGTAWFLGSALMGILYDLSPLYLILFSVVLQLTAIPILFQIRGK